MRKIAALALLAVVASCLSALPNAIDVELTMKERHFRSEPMGLTTLDGHYYDWREANGVEFDDPVLRRQLREAEDDAWADSENDRLAYEKAFCN